MDPCYPFCASHFFKIRSSWIESFVCTFLEMDVSATKNQDCCRGLIPTVQWTVPVLSSEYWSRTLRGGKMIFEHKMAHLHFVDFNCPTILFYFNISERFPWLPDFRRVCVTADVAVN